MEPIKKEIIMQKLKKINVTYYHRRPYGSYFSVERLFDGIRRALPSNIACRVSVSPFVSRGIWKRIANTLIAPFQQGNVNHITGDVHYLSLLLRKNKTILTILDCVTLNRLRGIKKSIFFFIWYWLPEKRSSLLTVISESTKRELLRYLHCDEKKIVVIHCCVSDDFKPSPKTFNASKPILLQVGTGHNKNLPRVAAALSGISCHLRIIGKLSKQQLAALAENRIEYSSIANLTDSEIVKEYRNSDIIIFVSTYEGFGLPIVEANAIGRPVLTSNISSMPEVAGDAAFLVDPFNVGDIRSGIVRLLNDPAYRDELIANGYKNTSRFAPKHIAEQYARLYEKLYEHNYRAEI